MTTNQAFLEQATEFAAATLRERPYVPTALLQNESEGPNGIPDFEVISLDGLKIDDMRDWPANVQRIAAQRGVQRVAFINEAWLTAEYPESNEGVEIRHAYQGWDEAFGATPEGNGLEIISITVESTDGSMLGAMYEIIDGLHGPLARDFAEGRYTSADKVWDLLTTTERRAQARPSAPQSL